MARNTHLRLLLAIATILVIAMLVPLHLSEAHHGDHAASHEGEGHVEEDHDVLATAGPSFPTLAPALSLAAEPAGDLARNDAPRTLGPVRRTDRLHDPPDPDQAALPPTPPRAPPTLRA